MLKKSPTGKLYIGTCFKRGFSTKRLAKIALKKTKKIKGAKCKLKSTYKCTKCGGWHLTHLTIKQYERKVTDYLLIKFLEDDLK